MIKKLIDDSSYQDDRTCESTAEIISTMNEPVSEALAIGIANAFREACKHRNKRLFDVVYKFLPRYVYPLVEPGKALAQNLFAAINNADSHRTSFGIEVERWEGPFQRLSKDEVFSAIIAKHQQAVMNSNRKDFIKS